jgi:hypothetical protein
MFVIEFIGAPNAGKTFYKNELLRDPLLKGYKIKDYRNFFYSNLKNVESLNLIDKNILRFYSKKNKTQKVKFKESNKNSKKFDFNFLRKFFQKRINILIEKQKISFRKNNFKFYNLVNFFIENKIEDSKRKENLYRWIGELFSSRNIYEQLTPNTDAIIDCEGFIHRLNSLIVSEEKNEQFINQYLEFCPKPDILIFVNEEITIIKDRIIHDNDLNKKNMQEKIIKKMHVNSNLIFNKLQKNSSNYFVINSKNFFTIKNKIISHIIKNYK